MTRPKIQRKPKSEHEVREYIAEKGYHFTAEDFVAYYGSQGWKKANGLPVTNWHLCCVTFERNWRERHPGMVVDKTRCPRCRRPNPEGWVVCRQCLKDLGSTDAEIESELKGATR